MKKSRFTESQIINALQEQQQGRKVQDIARELSIDTSTFYGSTAKIMELVFLFKHTLCENLLNNFLIYY